MLSPRLFLTLLADEVQRLSYSLGGTCRKRQVYQTNQKPSFLTVYRSPALDTLAA